MERIPVDRRSMIGVRSVAVITNENGVVAEHNGHDAWSNASPTARTTHPAASPPAPSPSPSPSPGPGPSPPSLKGADSTNATRHANGLELLRGVLGAGSFAPGPLASLLSGM